MLWYVLSSCHCFIAGKFPLVACSRHTTHISDRSSSSGDKQWWRRRRQHGGNMGSHCKWALGLRSARVRIYRCSRRTAWSSSRRGCSNSLLAHQHSLPDLRWIPSTDRPRSSGVHATSDQRSAQSGSRHLPTWSTSSQYSGPVKVRTGGKSEAIAAFHTIFSQCGWLHA